MCYISTHNGIFQIYQILAQKKNLSHWIIMSINTYWNISNISNINTHWNVCLSANIFSKVHMMGLVLTLLYLIGGLGAVVWFVVSHKDEEEVSVDERWGNLAAAKCRNDWKGRKSGGGDLEKIFPVSRWCDCGIDRQMPPRACRSKEGEVLCPPHFSPFSILPPRNPNAPSCSAHLNIQICSFAGSIQDPIFPWD